MTRLCTTLSVSTLSLTVSLFLTLALSSWMDFVNGNAQAQSNIASCPQNDAECEKDKFGYEAIAQLHQHIDDDQNGNLDRSESDEFIRDELKYEDGFDRQATFHGSDDLISIKDLWKLWKLSDVYNWTVDDVLDWLVQDVELPQYTENFRVNAVDGHMLPRLAANSQFMTSILGIKNTIHKQKLSVKSTDLVLFGPPKRHNYMKDLALVASLVIAVGGVWLAYVQHKYSQSHIKKVMRELEGLQKAEDSLSQLKHKLDAAEKEHKDVSDEKHNLEQKLKAEKDVAKTEAERLRNVRESTEETKSQLKLAEDELIQVRMALEEAERQLEDRSGAPLAELQQWLQLTYEIENLHYERKRENAEKQMLQAKEMCEKIRRKRTAFLGSLRIAHTTSMDDTDHIIMQARAALEDIKMSLQERAQRWQQIEKICGFNIVTNPGIQYLESLLRGAGSPTYGGSLPRTMSLSTVQSVGGVNLEDVDEDLSPSQLAAAVGQFPPNLQFSQVPHLPRVHSVPADMVFCAVPHQPLVTPGGASGNPEKLRSVWPNLMKAGMQLTMVGIGLTNPRMGGLHPQMTVGERRSMSLASAFGSSSGSLQTAGTGGVTTTRPAHSTAPKDGDMDDVSSSATVSNGGVKFELGETRNESVEDRTGTGSVRPRSLPTFSDPAVVTQRLTAQKRSASGKTHELNLPPPVTEEDSSPESTDSSSVEVGEHKEKKKKDKLFKKLLKGSRSTKQKDL